MKPPNALPKQMSFNNLLKEVSVFCGRVYTCPREWTLCDMCTWYKAHTLYKAVIIINKLYPDEV